MGPDDDSRFLARNRERYRSARRIRPLFAGIETYPAMLEAIASAVHSIQLETYIFASDATGLRFAEALAERASVGLDVRVIFDGLGSMTTSSTMWARMREAGVKLQEFHPVAPWRKRWNISRRDHRKILIVDNKTGFLGGINLGDDYADVADGGAGWHDMHCEITGDAVIDLAHMFRRTWLDCGGVDYPAPESPSTLASDRSPLLRILENGPASQRKVIRMAYLRSLAMARETVRLKNAYFLPDRTLRAALLAAARRGVAVDVIVPGHSDSRLVQWASYYVFRRLLPGGVRVWRWRHTMMHAKSAVIDGQWSTIGSCNLDARSLRYNLEVTAEIVCNEVGSALRDRFEDDMTTCEAFTMDHWHALPLRVKAAAWLTYRFRNWL
jgi:cardiolipin synthase A/B